ncbi:MAG TPA: hypothetical protein VGO47_05245 [Chlamydiales bacterium]|nr:hypothetical protein [Chlamydiales bacterium]
MKSPKSIISIRGWRRTKKVTLESQVTSIGVAAMAIGLSLSRKREGHHRQVCLFPRFCYNFREPFVLGLINHLKKHAPKMFKLFESVKAREGPLTAEEKQVAANAIPMDSPAAQKVLEQLNGNEGSVVTLFQKQVRVLLGMTEIYIFTSI